MPSLITEKMAQMHARLKTAAHASTGQSPDEALVDRLCRMPRPPYVVELDRKPEIVAFLDAHYGDWRANARTAAEPYVNMTIEDAKKPRAMGTIPALGRAWWATDDPAYGTVFERLYLDTETGELFNWRQFAGAQGAAELPAHLLLLDCDGYSSAGRVAFLDHLLALTERAWNRYVSQWSTLMLGPEGHNWYIHGIEALPYVGLLFPELQRADFFRRAGWNVLEEHLRGNYHRDGGSRETTPGYQAGSLMHLWRLYCLAQRNGWTVSSRFEQRLLRATHFLIRLMTPSGGVPAFGDTHTKPAQLVALAATAAALSGDPLCKWAAEQARACDPNDTAAEAGQIPASAFWNVGLAGAATYAQAKAQPPKVRSVCMPDTGFAVMRESWQPDAAYLAVTTAARGPIVTSHGHNDIFSFDLYALGTRFLGQLAFAPYGASAGRDYDQRSRAHNCMTVRGEEQVPLASEWRWDGCVLPRIRRWDVHDALEIFHGVHEGFYRTDRQTLHERKIVWIKPGAEHGDGTVPGYWVIFDRIESDTEQTYEAWFHGCVPASREDRDLMFHGDNGATLALVPPMDDALEVLHENGAAYQAYCEEAGVAPETCPAYAYAATAASCCFVWVLMPLRPDQPRPTVERLPVQMNGMTASEPDASAIRIRYRELTDELCLSHKAYDAALAWGAGDESCRAWGQLAFRRTTTVGNEAQRVVRSTLDGHDEALT